MFTGIVEALGTVQSIDTQGDNHLFWIKSNLAEHVKVDQSVSHSGVCLTVDALQQGMHRVTAIAETLSKTNLGKWQPGTVINLERCVPVNGRLDGHLVQGHVDALAQCTRVVDANGSWTYTFEFDKQYGHLVIEKGSVCLNGISLTCFNLTPNSLEVAIIPYTYTHTNLCHVEAGSTVNIEFDILGKYLARWKQLQEG
ncbi:MAG: riboflavin synthase [Bacteroidetes bacterium]|nr:MAG: riboflavin synthase [Bacteroidota bacterium]